ENFEKGKVILKLPISSSFHNVQHMVHGGVYASILDTTMGITLRSVGYDTVTTLSMNIDYLNGVKENEIQCVGNIIHEGRSTALVKARLYNSENQLLSHATGTFRALKNK